jgi:serine/threonine protein kinase
MSDPLIGKQLGDYTIQGLLGRGGMARVYKGYDDRLQRFAAVKVINTDFTAADQAEYTERFRREARAIARLQHPNIVSIYQFGEHDGNHYMAMAFLDGKDLRQILKEYAEKGTLMALSDVLAVIREVSSALDYAHNRGVIHRDIKPSNIMIDTEKRAVLTDFGLALTMSEGTLGDTFGSAHYIAPEQAVSSAKAVPQSDLYSLGICLYEILAGKVPFDDPSAMSVALKHLNESPPPPRQFNPNITQPIERVVLKILDKDPLERYRTGAEFTQALEAAIKAEGDDEATVKLVASKPETKKSEVATEPPAKPKSRAKNAKPEKAEQPEKVDKPAASGTGKPDAVPAPAQAAPVPAGEDDILSALARKNVKEVGASPSSTSTMAPSSGRGSGGVSVPAPAPVVDSPSGPRTREFPPGHLEKNAQQVAQAHGTQRAAGAASPPGIAGPGGSSASAAKPGEGAKSGNALPIVLVIVVLVLVGLGAAYFGGVFGPNIGSATPTPQAVALGTSAATSDGTSAVVPATGDATQATTDVGTDPATLSTRATTGRATATIRVTPTRATATPSNTPTPRVTRTPAVTNTTAAETSTASGSDGATPTGSTPEAGTPGATVSQAAGTANAIPTGTGGSDVALFYDGDQLVLVNISGRTLNISSVVFIQRGTENTEDLQFETTQWRQLEASASPDSLPAGSCFQVFRSGIVLPELLQNCRRGAWTRVTKPRWFWVSQDSTARTFEVMIGDRKVATCEINAGRCDFVLSE